MALPERFAELARELAARDPGVSARLADARGAADALRAVAVECVAAFCEAAQATDATHLADVAVSEVEPDKKHVDCLQFLVRRGRHELIAVAIASGSDAKFRLVGPFKRGKPEGPCADAPLRGAEVENALADRIEALLRQAVDR